MDNLLLINRLLSTPNGLRNSQEAITEAAEKFVACFIKPNSNLGDKAAVDEMRPILTSIRNGTPGCSALIEVVFASMLKILFRKAVNRDAIGKYGMTCIVQCLSRQLSVGAPAAAEMGNVVLNACYDSSNVSLFINEGGLGPLLGLLRSPETNVLASALGALQGICFTASGKFELRSNLEAIQLILRCLISDSMVVRARSCGTIHNLSSDPLSIVIIRDANNYTAIPMLVTLLHDPSPDICHAAAGTLQNLGRDRTAREMMAAVPETLTRLIDLLVGTDVKCQMAALGAIMNIVGPTIQEANSGAAAVDRDVFGDTVNTVTEISAANAAAYESFKSILADAIALGAIRSCVFDNVGGRGDDSPAAASPAVAVGVVSAAVGGAVAGSK